MQNTDAVVALAALAQVNRLEIFRLLVKAGPEGLAAGEIARELGLGPTRASFHLKELERAHLLIASRDGRFIRYSLRFETMSELMTFLTEDCCGGRPELCGAALEQPDCAVEAVRSKSNAKPEQAA